jgi:hypothetical protein
MLLMHHKNRVTSSIQHIIRNSTSRGYTYEANYSKVGQSLKLYGSNLNQAAVEGFYVFSRFFFIS